MNFSFLLNWICGENGNRRTDGRKTAQEEEEQEGEKRLIKMACEADGIKMIYFGNFITTNDWRLYIVTSYVTSNQLRNKVSANQLPTYLVSRVISITNEFI